MEWKRLLVPFLSVLTFVGCVGYLVLFRALCKTWRKKPLRSFLVLQMIVTALVYLLLQSTLTCLNFLELWVPLDVVSCVALAYTNTLFRIIILPVSLWMVIERCMAIWKPKCLSSFDSIGWGLLITGCLVFLTVLLSTLLLYFGLIGSECLQNPLRGDVIRWMIECILAVITLVLVLLCMRYKNCRPHVGHGDTRRIISHSKSSLFWFALILTLSSITVSSLQLVSAMRTMKLTACSVKVIRTVSSVIDNVCFSLLPVSLIMGKTTFGVSIIPGWLLEHELCLCDIEDRSVQSNESASIGNKKLDSHSSFSTDLTAVNCLHSKENPRMFNNTERVFKCKFCQSEVRKFFNPRSLQHKLLSRADLSLSSSARISNTKPFNF